MQCSLYYEIGREGFPYWNLLWGIPLGGVGCLIVVFSKNWFSWRLDKIGGILLAFFSLGAAIWAPKLYFDYRQLSESSQQGNYETVDGIVTDFKTSPPQTRGQKESFVVNGRKFSYSPYEIKLGFKQSQAHGGPIREGLHVRLGYVEERIVRLEICEPDK